MKLAFLRWLNHRHGDEGICSETNEALLDKADRYISFPEKPRPYLKFALATSIIFNFILLVLSIMQLWDQTGEKDLFQQMYSECWHG
jgi:hypothetical protein